MAQDLLCDEEILREYNDKNPYNKLKVKKFELLEILEGIENPSCGIIKSLSILISSKEIAFYKNKVRLFTKLNNVCECQICLEDKINIDLHCGHEVCIDCYKRVYEGDCPFCRATSYFDKCESKYNSEYYHESESIVETEITQ